MVEINNDTLIDCCCFSDHLTGATFREGQLIGFSESEGRGRDAILAAEKHLDLPHSFLRIAREIAYSHQEKWDGSGYPEGLSGDDIPISAPESHPAPAWCGSSSPRILQR